MTQINDGQNQIEVRIEAGQFEVTLKANQYQAGQQAFIETLLAETPTLLPGQLTVTQDNELMIQYALPKWGQTLQAASQAANQQERLRLAIMLNVLGHWQGQNVNLFLAPQNIWVTEQQIRLAHRGFEGVVIPEQQDSLGFLARYKALVLNTLNPKYEYVALVNGSAAMRNPFEQSIVVAENVQAITQILQAEYRRMTLNQVPVKQSRYTWLRWGFGVLVVSTLVLAGSVGYLSGVKAPEQTRVINSQAAFMTKDYNQTTDILKADNPKQLAKSAQYVLAASYINLDNLTNQQKKTLLNQISPQSDTNTLLYWINTGRGDFKTALSLAKNLGDNQLTLYAYTKLYDVTKADDRMDGTQKQKRLKQYQASIQKYVKKLGGKANGLEK
ncbi:type VII secretion protein EssB [Latilactobacillus fuchuensis]|uniref:Secretion system (Wss) component EssB n=1 Tax=Latilactobacillus fuchuensis TaxID=164393 RepID=A0A2N9DUY9_9LACO|nr:type VII secretion protein EssB [Latilactobacillus fuchuensis]SPC38262.1 Secretion system (Wss) component EssB [Latilactobacillus fuchuensis]